MGKVRESPALSYYLPEPIKTLTVLHIPGSHTLYIGPSACTRRHALHAMEFGERKNASFLFITEADVISGDYENLIDDAVGELMTIMESTPHIIILAVFCIDDFLGTDENAMLDRMHERFPDRRFAVQHINPVTLDEDPKNGKMKSKINMYSFMKPEKTHDNGINFLGNFISLEAECEFLHLLREWGADPVRELFNCNTYEDYQAMAKSRLAIGMRYVADDTIQYMTDTLSIPYYYFPTSYDGDFIAKGYREIAQLLGKPHPDLSGQVASAEQDARETASLLNGLPLALDCSGILMPFTAAKALMKYGFNIKYIFRSRHMFEFDRIAYKEIIANPGSINILWNDDYANLDPTMTDSNCLALGEDCARILNASYFANIWHDEGYYGFHGIHKLMSLIRKSIGVEKSTGEGE